MKLLDNMTVRMSWALVLVVFALLVLVLSGLGLYAVNYSEDALARFDSVNVDQQSTLNRVNATMSHARMEMAEIHDALENATTQDDREAAIERAEALEDELAEAEAVMDTFLELPARDDHEALIDEVEASFSTLMDEALWPQQQALAGYGLTEYSNHLETAGELNDRFYQDAVDFFRAAESEGHSLYEDFFSVASLLKWSIIVALVISAVTVTVVLWGVTVNVIRPLNRVIGHFDLIAKGDLSEPIEQRGNNEIGRLFASLAHMQHSLADIVGTVRRSGGLIHQGAQEISQGNSDLSARTEQQAASLQETASSMEELTSTVTQNADNARQASQLAVDASRTATRGGEVVGDVVGTMREIDQSSRKVSDIIEVIDSIAFQTNILALNASVEAARAGEQGRGFAVVASEVRNLASRSSDAAREIRDLIEASVAKVETGTSLVDQAGKTMDDIVASVQRVTDIMDEIAAASEEQSHGIGQVNDAVTQMDQVTQQNAALVQQAANGASELEVEAGRLRDAVSLFRLAERDAPEAEGGVRLPHRQLPSSSGPQGKPAAEPTRSDRTVTRSTEEEWEAF
ncbi:methyl-accepting chemotaxis protein [Aidingimonas halophila]|uniref:Methyl-accepting chemotaxis sensory transducer with TarH sensor n=1 Tax=Aidingimonas halophila TaxID=574349 RepID=A0A1H3GD31_9GAMM|nr:methyl-accepting chemotaxis protein [Aidingimonas halophila]GHC33022.1 methyl-accepting chemotaxis aspartate transducer [Aidingimonas halophila]SDY01252.1 methyl-accepting chemotaxis sensory transducer with TarH sensor [Aidingimonas halophila]